MNNLTIEQAIAAVRLSTKLSDQEILNLFADKVQKKTKVDTSEGPSQQIDAMAIVLGLHGILQRNNRLVTINHSPEAEQCYTYDNLAPRIQPILLPAMLKHLHDAAIFDPKPPKPAYVAALHALGHYPDIPTINGIVTHPILLPDGSIVRDPGYNKRSGYYLHLTETFPELMETPKAVSILRDLYTDFPFNSEADLSAMLAYVLTLVSRYCINGPCPMFVFDGNRPGVGKGILVDSGSIISQGRRASLFPGQSSPDEIRKHMFSSAMNATPLTVFDNVTGAFGNSEIESILTSTRMDGRILGQSSQVEVSLCMTFAMTANGALLSKDMCRRVVRITLDTEEASPELRTGFKYPYLLEHIKAERPTILMAALSIVANHLKAGCPNALPLGSFDAWSRIVRSAIVNAGLVDPYSNTINRAQEAVAIESDVVALHKAWAFDEPLTVAEVVERVEKSPTEFLLMANLLDKSENKIQYLGYKLRAAAGLVVENKSFKKQKGRHPRWRLI